MNEKQFWDLVETAGRDRAGAFRRSLESLSEEDLEEYVAEYGAQRRALMLPRFLAQIDPPKTVERLAEIAEWVVARGQNEVESVLFEEKPFPPKIPAGEAVPRLDQEAAETYRQRTGRWIPHRAPQSDDAQLDSHRFWALVELARTNRPAFVTALEQMRPEDLIEFHWEHDAVRNLIMTPRFRAHLDPQVTASWESWMEFADWIIGLGRSRFESILSDPRSIPESLPPGAGPLLPDVEAARVFERRYGEDLPLRKKDRKVDVDEP